MIQYENVQQAMGIDVAISQKMSEAIYLWKKLYINEAPWLNADVRSLNLPAAISSEMARLVTMESEVTISGSPKADLIARYLKPFLNSLPVYAEYACNAGGVVFKPYIDGDGISVDVVQAGFFYPVEFDSANNITAAIFPEFKRDGKKLYTRLEYQKWDGDKYIIVNKAFVSRKAMVKNDNVINLGQEISLEDVPEWEDIAPYVEFEHADRMLFSYFRIPLANNIDTESPLGVSVYSRAINQIKDADEQYGATLWEFRSKETAIQASSEFFKRDRKGNVQLPKGKERQYHDMGASISDNDGKPFFNVYSPDIRDQSFFNGYNKIVQKVEFNSGLAYGTLSDPQLVDKTAEEIKASKQRSYATVKSIQNSLGDAIETLVAAIDAWMAISGIASDGTINIAISWDDSLVTDKKTEREQDLQDLAAGIMQPWEFRAKWYGEDKETAMKAVGTPAEVIE
ncbi:phage portal protein [Faecalicatena contorta]|nr:phage portal protein [Faecalicatena contorta]